jgi:hypothetical protein
MFKRILPAFVAGLLLLSGVAFAGTTLDQAPIPLNTLGNNELLIQNNAVAGGTLYTSIVRSAGPQGGIQGVANAFVSVGATSPRRYVPLTGAKADTGVGLTATATSGAMGIARTAGTSLTLVGEATSASAKTDKALWELNLADSYVAGAAIPCVVNANYTTSGTVTAAATTITVAAYTEVNGVETAIAGITAAQQFTATGADYTFSIPGTGLAPGSHIVVEIVMLVTTSVGAATGQINSTSLQE